MEQIKEILKKRTTWIILLLLISVILIIYYIRKKKAEDHESAFADLVRNDALKDKVTEKEMELNQYMRKLWGENTTWMRSYVTSYMNNSSDLKDVTRRLLQNQEQIGKSFGLWYGEPVGKEVTSILQKNLISFGDVLKEMMDKNKNAAMAAESKWDGSTDNLVSYLTKLNPEWDSKTLSDHFKKFNNLNITQAMAKANRKHQEEIETFDKAYNHAMYELADFITSGIVRQHPDKFDKGSAKSTTAKNIESIKEEDNSDVKEA